VGAPLVAGCGGGGAVAFRRCCVRRPPQKEYTGEKKEQDITCAMKYQGKRNRAASELKRWRDFRDWVGGLGRKRRVLV